MSVSKAFRTAAFCVGALIAASTSAQAATVIANGSFESPTTGSYIYPGATVDSWTYMGAGLIDATNGSAWYGNTPPSGYDGEQYAFVQGTGSLSQIFTSGSGLFRLSWLEASRPALGCCNGNQTYQVRLDNAVVGTFATLSGQQFQTRSLVGPLLTSGQHTLAFVGLSVADNTAFIDNVSGAVPEPAAWGLMIVGFGGMGAMLRRRRSAAVTA